MTTMIFHLTAFFLANFGGFTEMVRYGWTDIRTYGRTYGRTHRHKEKEAYARNFVIVRTVRSVKNRVNLLEVSMGSLNVYNENDAFFRILFFSSIARNIMTSIK